MMDRSVAKNKALMRKIVDMFATGDLSQVSTVIATEYIDHQGLQGVVITGADGFSRVVAAARTGCSDLRISIEDLMAEGDRVAARLRWVCLRPTGEKIARETIDILRFANGQAVEHWGTRFF